ncbi:hypothetical protein U1Q18_041669, partial [Sarracenia purpurea var. burkii]
PYLILRPRVLKQRVRHLLALLLLLRGGMFLGIKHHRHCLMGLRNQMRKRVLMRMVSRKMQRSQKLGNLGRRSPCFRPKRRRMALASWRQLGRLGNLKMG